MSYVLAVDEVNVGCIFCAFPSEGPAQFRKNLILCAQPHAFVIMNKFPYNNGHIMVVPRTHGGDPGDLGAEEYQATTELVRRATRALRAALGADGFNVGMNLGRTAGAGIDAHCHYHIVPRWNGDTNFMPVLGEVKVMSEHVQSTYERLLAHFAALGEGPA
jgi:ATP adenylyltransferase